jgi:phosphoribosyl 1,2-cyclic phosphodiesterase
MRVSILGSGGGAPSGERETACVLVRDGAEALLLDAGTGARRLIADPGLLDGVRELDVVLTHFHFDHVCGLPYLPWACETATIWAPPGTWLYKTDSAEILDPLRRPPMSSNDVTDSFAIEELRPGRQQIGGFKVRARSQPRHWAPSAGLRVDDLLAYVTDTPYEPSSRSSRRASRTCSTKRGRRRALCFIRTGTQPPPTRRVWRGRRARAISLWSI